MKKSIFLTVFLLIILIANISFASYSTVTMNVVEEPICTINFGENSKFEKKLISKDLNNKEVTLQLQITNEEIPDKTLDEVVLVIDNSNSMKESTDSGDTRGEVIRSSAKTLATNLLKSNRNLKIGAVSFSTVIPTSQTDPIIVGTENDSTLLTNLTSDVNILTNSIDNIYYASDSIASYTDLEAGLSKAKSLFTNTNNTKYMLILTDGIHNVILGRNAVKYDNATISATKSEYQSIIDSNINIITMLTGISNGNIPIDDTMTYNQYIEKIFGTSQNPNYGSFFYITDDKIKSTTDAMYDLINPRNKTFKDIKIVDYFPKEIVDNFEFSYVQNANIGTISTAVDKTNNSITWSIPELEVGKTATVQYKLKLKENFDSSIINKILNTNQKVDLNYTDYDNSNQSKTSYVTPKIKLIEPPPVLPKSGLTTIIIAISGLLLIIAFSVIKILILNNKMK